jgi:hypothetical protein
VIDVTVKVAEGRLSEFYAMYATWLKTEPSEERSNNSTLSDWASGDVDEARHVWSKMNSGAKKLFEILLGASAPVAGDQLAGVLGQDAGEDTVFGTFGPPAKLAKEVGRKHMIKSEHTPLGNSYWLEPTVKALFAKVQAERG